MAKLLTLGIVAGTAAGIASALVLHFMGIELTPAVTGGVVGASAGAVASGAFSKSKGSTGDGAEG